MSKNILKKRMTVAWLAVALALVAPAAKADVLSDVLGGAYNAHTLRPAEMDSILNPAQKMTDESALSAPGRYRLEFENEVPIYRHSTEADCYLVDTKKGTRDRLCAERVLCAEISPNGKYVVYAKTDHNLYIYKLDFKSEVAITRDGIDPLYGDTTESCIFNGVSDWLYEEEFGITQMFWFSPDSKQVAFVRLDEQEVPTMMWQNYLAGPGAEGQYPTQESLRYPKAGCPNAKASVCVYDIYLKQVKTMQLPEREDGYVPRLMWDNSEVPQLVVAQLNRDQNELEVSVCDTRSTVAKRLYYEKQKDYYYDFQQLDEWQWLSDNRFLVVSEKSGWRQVFLYSKNGQELRQLTRDGKDITAVYGLDEKSGMLYYQAAPTPQTRQCYALNLKKGEETQLTQGDGWHSLTFRADMRQAIECYESVLVPNRYSLCRVEGAKLKVEKVLLDNAEVAEAWQQVGFPEKEWIEITTPHGDVLYGWVLRSPKTDAQGKSPVVMTQYSGPASQRVVNRWRKRFEYALAMEGYTVVCVDPRGTDGRGCDWRKQTYMELGKKEAEDQIALAAWVARQDWADAGRISMIGWSYGGFQVIRTMEEQGIRQRTINEAALIKKGVAIAPVTDWRLYDSAYTERYMRRPQVNEGGYKGADLKTMAGDLKGELLLVHGMADDNVHAQHSMQMADALVEAGVQFDMMIYPDDNHFLRKRNNYDHLHRLILRFLGR